MSDTVFLWGNRYSLRDDDGPQDGEWWRQYSERLSLTPTALEELADSSRGVARLLPVATLSSEVPRPVRGLVVGAVQSGKTAHMIAVTARALDAGYRVVVVLAGLKDDLRAQTARRFNVQLLRQRDSIAGTTDCFTMDEVSAFRRVAALAPPYHRDCHQWALFHVRMMQAMTSGLPIIAVIKKNPASLANMREHLRQLWKRHGRADLPMLVLDDECDEASVEPEEEAPTPQLIADLWRTAADAESGTVAYVGYTATSAANLLQRPENELYPTDFVVPLKVPAAFGTLLSFAEPDPHAWYSGGEAFYTRFASPEEGIGSLLVETIVSEAELAHPESCESIRHAVRVFLLGAAITSLEEEQSGGTDVRLLSRPRTMIVQASTAISDHAEWATAIRRFLGMPDSGIGLGIAHLERDILQQSSLWQEGFESLERSRIALSELHPHPWPLRIFPLELVLDRLRLLGPVLRLRILNSDPRTVDTLDFEGKIKEDGSRELPEDMLSIIVGGARLSRGLTIEGLAVSFFARRSEMPTEDTLLQLSRWYGYRGRHLDLCRVFTTPGLAAELMWASEHDSELRLRLCDLISRNETPSSAGLVLSSIPHGLPTAKIGVGRVRDVSYSPWTRVINYVDVGSLAYHNEELAANLWQQITTRPHKAVRNAVGQLRGLVSPNWEIEEIARILDSMVFSAHNPEPSKAVLSRHYRARDQARDASAVLPEDLDPYAIAAYLKRWKEHALRDKIATPVFNVCVAYGRNASTEPRFPFPLSDREVLAGGFVNGGWVGRSEGWHGDQWFDHPVRTSTSERRVGRSAGDVGMLLMYVIDKDARGRRGAGVPRSYHSPMFGIAVPGGGPVVREVVLHPRDRDGN